MYKELCFRKNVGGGGEELQYCGIQPTQAVRVSEVSRPLKYYPYVQHGINENQEY